MAEKEARLVELPQTGVVVDIDSVYVIGEPKPSQWIVAFKGGTQGAVLLPGDVAALKTELKRRGAMVALDMPGNDKAPVDAQVDTSSSRDRTPPVIQKPAAERGFREGPPTRLRLV
jgi:hypothetical protein